MPAADRAAAAAPDDAFAEASAGADAQAARRAYESSKPASCSAGRRSRPAQALARVGSSCARVARHAGVLGAPSGAEKRGEAGANISAALATDSQSRPERRTPSGCPSSAQRNARRPSASRSARRASAPADDPPAPPAPSPPAPPAPSAPPPPAPSPPPSSLSRTRWSTGESAAAGSSSAAPAGSSSSSRSARVAISCVRPPPSTPGSLARAEPRTSASSAERNETRSGRSSSEGRAPRSPASASRSTAERCTRSSSGRPFGTRSAARCASNAVIRRQKGGA